jgi:hypothetical protein
MNVLVRPTVRCTFDEEDSVLRIILKEAVEYGDEAVEPKPQELVVYALKVCYNFCAIWYRLMALTSIAT